jgi:ribonuclease P protein component
MLSKKNRLDKDTLNTIMEKGSISSGSFFVLRYIKSDIPQYSFVVSKKIAKNAVKRNYLRRKGYNILRLYKIDKNKGVFFYKKEALLVPDVDIKKDIDFLLKKSKII